MEKTLDVSRSSPCSSQEIIVEAASNLTKTISKIYKRIRLALLLTFITVGGNASCFAHLSPEGKSTKACEQIEELLRSQIPTEVQGFIWRHESYNDRVFEDWTGGHRANDDFRRTTRQTLEKFEFFTPYCHDPIINAKAHAYIGTAQELLRNYSSAIQEYSAAIQVVEHLPVAKNIVRKMKKGIIRIYSENEACKSIQATHIMRNERLPTETLKFLEIYKKDYIDTDECKSELIKALLYTDLGASYEQLKDYEKAQQNYREAIRIFEKMREEIGPFGEDNVITKTKGRSISDLQDYKRWLTKYDLEYYLPIIEAATRGEQHVQEQQNLECIRTEKERLAKAEITNAVQELHAEISLGQQAERRGDYREAEKHFYRASNEVRFRVLNAYKNAETPIPRDIEELGYEIGRGLRENQERLGIAQVGRPRDQDDFSVGWSMLRDNLIAELPGMGIVTTKVVQIGDKLRENLAREGLIADLEITFIPAVEEMEVTVIRKSPTYSSNTFKTSKESILNSGGKVTFHLAPGTYELNCAKFKEPYTVEVKPGQTSLTIELQR